MPGQRTCRRKPLPCCLPWKPLQSGACTQERERRPASCRSPRMLAPLQQQCKASSEGGGLCAGRRVGGGQETAGTGRSPVLGAAERFSSSSSKFCSSSSTPAPVPVSASLVVHNHQPACPQQIGAGTQQPVHVQVEAHHEAPLHLAAHLQATRQAGAHRRRGQLVEMHAPLPGITGRQAGGGAEELEAYQVAKAAAQEPLVGPALHPRLHSHQVHG